MYREDVVDLVEDRLGFTPEKVIQFNDGVNTVFDVRAADARYVVKIGTYDPTSVRIEPYLLRRLSQYGLPTPEIYVIDEIRNFPAFVAEYLPGTVLSYPNELPEQELKRASMGVGQILGEMHTLEFQIGEFRVNDGELDVHERDWENFFHQFLQRFVRQAKQNYPHLGSESSRLIHWSPIPSVSTGRFVPIDLHTGNVFVNESLDIVGLTDFERCYAGHPRWAYDTTLHTLSAGREADIRETVEDRFEKGYRQARGTVPDPHPVFELAAVLREMRAAHMWWEDTGQQEERLKKQLNEIEQQIRQSTQ